MMRASWLVVLMVSAMLSGPATPLSQWETSEVRKVRGEFEPPPLQFFGSAIDLEGDRALIGAPGLGGAFIYDWNGTEWVRHKFRTKDFHGFGAFGGAVALQGEEAFVSANGTSIDAGTVRFFQHIGDEWLEQQILVPSQSAGGDLFGRSLALQGDLLVVGSSYLNSRTGAAFVFERQGSSWVEVQSLMASDATSFAYFGDSVDLNGDRIVVGSTKGAYVFENDGGAWVESEKLVPASGGTSAYGTPASLDGNVVVVGDYFDQHEGHTTGAAYVFRFDGVDWIEEQRLEASDAAAADSFGRHLTVSGDTIVIGATGDDDFAGGCYVFDFDSGVWSETVKLTASDRFRSVQFGAEMAIDGQRLFVGAPRDGELAGLAGAAYVFDLQDGVWNETEKLLSQDSGISDRFGSVIAMDGDVAAIGVPLGDVHVGDGGHVALYDRVHGDWIRRELVVPADGNADDHFGASVAFSDDFLVIGADLDNANEDDEDTGAVYVRSMKGGDLSKILASQRQPGDRFGGAVALEGTWMAASAPFADGERGRVVLFEHDGNAWIERSSLTAGDATPGQRFGTRLGMDGGFLVVGAPFDDEAQVDAGAVYVYEFDHGTWTFREKLLPSTPTIGGFFGDALAISGEHAWVGAPLDSEVGDRSGSVSVYRFQSGSWVETETLNAHDSAAYDLFGSSVAIEGDTAIVGAPRHDWPDERGGAAYVFVFDGANWQETQRLIPTDISDYDELGFAVGLSEGAALVGAPFELDGGVAYFFGTVGASVLEISPTSVQAGETLTFAHYYGPPGGWIFNVVVDVNDVPVFNPLFIAHYESDLRHELSATVPPGLSGLSITFRSLTLTLCEEPTETADVVVDFQ